MGGLTLGLENSLSKIWATGGIYSTYALALDFDDQEYWSGGTEYASLALVPGYAFTRSGEQGAVDASGAVQWFAANEPAINSAGYHVYGALTNYALRSQEFGSAPWGPFGNAAFVGSNTAVAPDGTTSADRIEFTGAGGIYYQAITGPTGFATLSVWAKAVSGTVGFRLYTLVGANQYSPDFVATTDWQRFDFEYDAGASTHTQFALAANSGGTLLGQLDVWQAQLINGNFADGGPAIRTAGATASIGASALAVSLANGTYDATYTFDDASTQNNPALVIGDGALNLPTDFAPNRNIIEQLIVND